MAISIPEGIELDEYACATLSALLAGYYEYYGATEVVAEINAEVQFGPDEIEGCPDFHAQGKIDGLGTKHDQTTVLIEAKTTGDSLKPDSGYWDRLRFNPQLHQYYEAARQKGWEVAAVIYNATRKLFDKAEAC